MTKEQETYIEEIADGHVPSKDSVESRAWDEIREQDPFTPAGWVDEQMDRARRLAGMSMRAQQALFGI